MLCKDGWGLAWYDGLRGDTVAPVVDHYCSQRVDAFRVNLRVGLHSLQVTALSHTQDNTSRYLHHAARSIDTHERIPYFR